MQSKGNCMPMPLTTAWRDASRHACRSYAVLGHADGLQQLAPETYNNFHPALQEVAANWIKGQIVKVRSQTMHNSNSIVFNETPLDRHA